MSPADMKNIDGFQPRAQPGVKSPDRLQISHASSSHFVAYPVWSSISEGSGFAAGFLAPRAGRGREPIADGRFAKR